MSTESTTTVVAGPAAEGSSESPRRAASSLKDELKTFIAEKRKSSVPEEVEDYRKLSVCAVTTGVAIAIIRQRMLERKASGQAQLTAVVPIAFVGLYTYTLWRDDKLGHIWQSVKGYFKRSADS